jgi:preprotein translocase subunit SecF
VFNLVGKRYLFLLISLVVIIPGAVSLVVKGLNVGIDFAGGATIELRPSTSISAPALKNILKPLNLANLDVLTGDNTALPANQVAWIKLNTRIDQTVQNDIQSKLQSKYGSTLVVQFADFTVNQKFTVVTLSKFPTGAKPTVKDIEGLLTKIPNTTDLSKPAAAVTPTAESTPKVLATPTPAKATVTPTATAKSTGTPTAGATPTATPTTSNPAATIPVHVVNAQIGSTTNTVSLLTSSEVNIDKLVQIQATIFNSSNTYTYVINNATVSSSVAADTSLKAFLAVLASSVCILLYIWFSFRKVSKPWRYGACAIIALLHDVLVVLGVFSILGWLLGIQIDTLFITALLTVVGFSVHDTIVVFDRIRENMQRRTSETFEQVVNASLVQTMARSLNTSLTVLFTLSALTLFGGVTIRTFTLTLLVGIFSGTYSSIFNASMLLAIWEKGELGLWRFNRTRTPDGRDVRELARTRG